jgi:hypothetical protein
MNREEWIEENCTCGISEKTGKWSELIFYLFGCTCDPDIEEYES